MAHWYVYQHDGDPLGPWSTAMVGEAILAGKLSPDVWVAAPGGPRWLRALDVPVIGQLVDGIPTRPRRDSGLRLIAGAFRADASGSPVFGSTMMIVEDQELDLAEEPDAVTARNAPPSDATLQTQTQMQAPPEDDATDPTLPPSSSPSTPPLGGVDREIPMAERLRRRKNG